MVGEGHLQPTDLRLPLRPDAAPLAADSELIKIEAIASYYGDEFQGRPTSSGELFDMNAHTCAHKTLPFGTLLEITNLENGRVVTVQARPGRGAADAAPGPATPTVVDSRPATSKRRRS